MEIYEKEERLPEEWRQWRLREQIGEGSGGRVYRAERIAEGEADCEPDIAAIKILHGPEGAFELAALNRLKGCPQIVAVEDQYIRREPDGQCTVFLRMEYLKSLAKLLHERPLTEEEALEMMIDLCRGLERCEREGILHRDIKPENILVTAEGRAKLGDFSIAKETGQEERTGAAPGILGSFSYMPPEMFYGKGYDRRSDLYSLGLVFYRVMNRGREPFVSPEKQISSYKEREQALEKRMAGQTLPPPAQASPGFARILQKACRFQQKRRYQSGRKLRRSLEKCLSHKNNPLLRMLDGWSLRCRMAAVVFLLALLGCGGHWFWMQSPLLEYVRPEDGFTCRLNRGGTLRFSGAGTLSRSGSMEGWRRYSGRVKRIVFQGAVRSVEEGFGTCALLEQVEFPEGVESIGAYAFDDCPRLEVISFPSTLKEIGELAFGKCGSLKRLRLPEGLETISDSAFFYCQELEQVEFPSTLLEIGEDAFAYTPWLEAQKEEEEFLVINDILLFYFGEAEEVVLPENSGIRRIGPKAFAQKERLKRVVLPDCVEAVGQRAFEKCTSLQEVVLPGSLKELPEALFSVCEALEKVEIPEGVERIGENAFSSCTSLREISLPDSLQSIGRAAFFNTAWYDARIEESEFIVLDDFLLEWTADKEELVIPDTLGIRRIADYAIEEKDNLRRAVIPEGVVSLGECCFFFCGKLEEIVFPRSLTEFGRGPMAGTKWMAERQPFEGGVPVLVNGVDVSY